MRGTLIRLCVAVIFISTIIVIHASGLSSVITLDGIQQHRHFLMDYVAHHYYHAVAWYMGCYVLTVLFFIPVAAVMAVIGGFLFGISAALLYVVSAATSGALISFLLVRYMIGAGIQKRYAVQLHSFNQAVERDGVLYLLIIRCVPIIPFAVINTVAGLTRISLATFMWTTALGIIPTTLMFSFAGQQLNALNNGAYLLSAPLLLVLAGTICLVLLSYFWRDSFKSLLRSHR